MQAPLLVIDHQHASGRHGLAVDIRVAEQLGALPMPVVSANATGPADEPRKLQPVAWRNLKRSLADVVAEEPVAAFVGTLCRKRQVRNVADLLRNEGPPMTVVAPLSLVIDVPPMLGRGTLAAIRKELVPDAGVVVLPAAQAGLLVDGAEASIDGMKRAAAELLESGARVAWIRAMSLEGRHLDVIADRQGSGLLDYPQPGPEAEPHAAGAALAAMLAIGTSPREAIDRAHRHVYALDRSMHRTTG